MRSNSQRFPSRRRAARIIVPFALGALALTGTSTSAESQRAHPSAERAAVDSVISGLFDAMRKGDSAAVRRAFHPRATLSSASLSREGVPQLTFDAVEGFVKAVGTPHPDIWDERIHEPVTQVDANMAVVWAPYTFYLGAVLSHCGTNAFQLAKDAEGWRIISLVDTRRRTGCRAGGPA